MLKRTALAAIRLYQKHLSPRKGFSCAHRGATNGLSCSAYGYQAIDKHGVMLGLSLLRRRLDACAWRGAQNRLSQKRAGPVGPFASQGGFVDGCAGAEGCVNAGSACEVASLVAECAPCEFEGCGPSEGARRHGKRREETAERRGL
jgi:putative component of membrane protein insertase Oxa1/YidC/SpoIIIJ protein YidD